MPNVFVLLSTTQVPPGGYTVFISDVVSARVSVHTARVCRRRLRVSVGDYVSPDTSPQITAVQPAKTAMTWR